MTVNRDRYAAVVETPLPGGWRLGLVCTGSGLAVIDFLPAEVPIRGPEPAADAAVRALTAYFEGRSIPPIALDLAGTPFQQRVWSALTRLVTGQTVTYGALAASLATSARAAAAACRANPVPILVPCHRVVSASGQGGYMGRTDGPELAIKNWLLHHEQAH